MIAQVPDFGDRFWVYALYDARTDQFGELGKPYGTKPGFYLLAGPSWNGLTPRRRPAVIQVCRRRWPTPSRGSFRMTPRRQRRDPVGHQQIDIYPLEDFTGNMKTIDWANVEAIPGPQSTPAGRNQMGCAGKILRSSSPTILNQVDRCPAKKPSTRSSAPCWTPRAKDPA